MDPKKDTWEARMAKKAAERRKIIEQEEYEQGQREMEDEGQILSPPEGHVGWWA